MLRWCVRAGQSWHSIHVPESSGRGPKQLGEEEPSVRVPGGRSIEGRGDDGDALSCVVGQERLMSGASVGLALRRRGKVLSWYKLRGLQSSRIGRRVAAGGSAARTSAAGCLRSREGGRAGRRRSHRRESRASSRVCVSPASRLDRVSKLNSAARESGLLFSARRSTNERRGARDGQRTKWASPSRRRRSSSNSTWP